MTMELPETYEGRDNLLSLMWIAATTGLAFDRTLSAVGISLPIHEVTDMVMGTIAEGLDKHGHTQRPHQEP